jgi:uncharacterized protein (DUF2062 family)
VIGWPAAWSDIVVCSPNFNLSQRVWISRRAAALCREVADFRLNNTASSMGGPALVNCFIGELSLATGVSILAKWFARRTFSSTQTYREGFSYADFVQSP